MNVTVVNRRTIEGRFEPSLLPIITEEVAGLFTTSRGIMGYGVSAGSAGGMTIRGIGSSPTTGVLLLIDGHPQFMGMMGHPLPDAYQGLMAERVEVVQGPASALYGSNAMGGVINIITKKNLVDGVHTHANLMYGSYNTASAQVSNAVRQGKFTSYVALGYNRTDGHRPFMEFEQYNGYAKLGYDMAKHWRTFVDFNLTGFKASNPGVVSGITGNDADILRGVASAAVENSYGHSSGALKLFYNFGQHHVTDRDPATGALNAMTHFESTDYVYGANLYQSYQLTTGTEITAKADLLRYGGRAWNAFANGNPNRVHADTAVSELAGYIGLKQTLFESLTLSGGVRLSYNQMFGTEWIPQAGITYSPTTNTTLKAILGKGFRNPTMRELFMFAYNNDLLPERIMSYELAYSQDLLAKDLQLTLSGYFLSGDNTIITGATGQPENTGTIENYGLELSSRYRISSEWSVSASYAWLNMRTPVLAAPEHKLHGTLSFAHGKWSAATGLQYVAGLYTAVGVSPATTSFALWNARLGYRILKALSLFVKGENMLNQRYEINAGYPMPGATVYGGISLQL
jgi:outer membrane receptor protein involved in Fe transport